LRFNYIVSLTMTTAGSAQEQVKLPMPSGWFRIATSHEVRRGEVHVFKINGREVVDGALRCPFHGLRFNQQGRCVGTEYPESPEVSLSVRAWPVMEQLGCIFVHVGHNGAAPTWELPRYDTDGWTEPVTKVLTLKGHVQDVAENAVDFGHFSAVHEYSDLLDPTLTVDGPRMHSKFGFSRRHPFLPGAKVESVFDTDVHGLGLSVTDLTSPKLGIHFRVVLSATQVDEDTMTFGIGLSSECPPPIVPRAIQGLPWIWRAATRAQIRLVHPLVVSDVLQDKEIWEHRVPMEVPALMRGDGPIAKYRHWVKQFYA
jgi:hypothetical protein